MQSFRIGDTEFGLDPAALRVELTSYSSGETRICFDFAGDPSTLESLIHEDDVDWSWAQSPPSLFMHDVPLPPGLAAGNGEETREFDRTLHEFGLYFMDHCEVQDFMLKILPGKSIEVSGQADIWGQQRLFLLRCEEVEWDIRSNVEPSGPVLVPYPRWRQARDWTYRHRWLFLSVGIGLIAAVCLEAGR